MSLDFRCTVHDPARKANWVRWLGTDTVPVRAYRPCIRMLSGAAMAVYLLDQDALTPMERDQVAAGIAETFQMTLAEVMEDMEGRGIAIPAEGCSVQVRNPHKWAR